MQREINKEDYRCAECGNEFKAWKSQKRTYCSNECRLKALHRTTPAKKKTGENRKCAFCGKDFYVPKWRDRVGKGKYCSKECYWAHKPELVKGPNNSQYIDGRTKNYSKAFYLSAEWRRFRKGIYERDKYTCQECGNKGGRLHAHHKIPVGACADSFEKDNIITLCQKCHSNIGR